MLPISNAARHGRITQFRALKEGKLSPLCDPRFRVPGSQNAVQKVGFWLYF
jgi:hypothetical protein